MTVLFGIASTASLLLKAPVSDDDTRHKVRLSIQVGIPAPLHQDLVDRWGVPWVEAYGLTETGLIVSVPVEQAQQMIGSGSIGLPCPGAEVRIVDPRRRARSLTTSSARSWSGRPALMRGYLNRPEATAETFRGGWLHTGDLGRRDSGRLPVLRGPDQGRHPAAGENIAAAEVETVLRSHPGVLEVAAVPVPDDPARRGGQGAHSARRRAESCVRAARRADRVQRCPARPLQGAALRRVPHRGLRPDTVDAGEEGEPGSLQRSVPGLGQVRRELGW